SERLSHTDDSLAESTNGGSRPDQETRTILGGIRQVKHIGRYVVEKEIGRGSMGLVYKAWDPKLDRTVVIKQVTFEGRGGTYEIDRLKERLHREAMAAAQLNHPNIVIVYDVGEAAAFSYIVMEYVEGQDLKALLARSRKFPLARTVAIVSQICEALEFAHRHGVVHRDIKPSNILVTRGDRIKIADFGIAKMPKFDTLTLTGNVVGTPFYMSPEQVEGRRLDGRTDIFSTGVVLYEMLTGIRPFAGESIPTVVYKIVHKMPKLPSLEDGDLPPHFDRIVEKALAKDPEERYATAGEMLEELTRVQQEFG
ncbi:MAG: serine/threonine protein kinase, partial [Calditrichaeota bacterium]